jgi:hypothetical protein
MFVRNGTCESISVPKLPTSFADAKEQPTEKRACRDSSIERWSATASLMQALEKRWSICAFN